MTAQNGLLRGHNPLTIEEFNGLWKRGDIDSVPPDHWADGQNIVFTEGGYKTRDGLDVLTINGSFSLPNVLQVKPYRKPTTEGLLVLDNTGNIYDTDSPTPATPILTIVGMIDFGLFIFAGRAYISPTADQISGMASQFMYVYKGDGTAARLAGGAVPQGAISAVLGATGHVQAGYHFIGVVFETDTGFFTQIGPEKNIPGNVIGAVVADGIHAIDLSGIPVPVDSFVVKKHLVVTAAVPITLFNGDVFAYEYFFLPNGELANATTTATIDFYDSELLDSADYLLDIYPLIPAGVGLGSYKGRTLNWSQNPSDQHTTILVSKAGQPEVFDKIEGVITVAQADESITICQELRDVLYIFTNVQCYATQDNGSEPAEWGDPSSLNQGLGSSLHGIAFNIDLQQGVNVDFLIIANLSGIWLFNGLFNFPELSYKIADLWTSFDFSTYIKVQFYNDTVLKRLYCIMPDQQSLLYADYQHTLDPMKIRWIPWKFDVEVTSICLRNVNELVIASAGPVSS